MMEEVSVCHMSACVCRCELRFVRVQSERRLTGRVCCEIYGRECVRCQPGTCVWRFPRGDSSGRRGRRRGMVILLRDADADG